MLRESRMFVRSFLSVGASGLAFFVFPCAAAAQAQAGDAARTQDSGGLQEVVVTAQRRSENSQRVPLSIQTIDGQAIANAGYTNVTDLQYLAPGVQYDPTQGAAFQIRG